MENSGDIALQYDAYRVTIDGQTRNGSPLYEKALAPGDSALEGIYFDDSIHVESGSYTMRIALLFDGQVVGEGSETVEVS